MYIYVEIVDVVANAFIKLLDQNDLRREIFYKDLDQYGADVIEYLNKDDSFQAVFIVSKESQQAVVDNYSEFFEEFEKDGCKGIRLKEGRTAEELWLRFCASLSVKVITAFQKVDVEASV